MEADGTRTTEGLTKKSIKLTLVTYYVVNGRQSTLTSIPLTYIHTHRHSHTDTVAMVPKCIARVNNSCRLHFSVCIRRSVVTQQEN